MGKPSIGTFEDTFGTAEVWHELLDPVFGHPVLTGLYFGFYTYFLKGTGDGGLATGFCTSLASLVAEKFWNGDTDTTTLVQGDVDVFLTGLHGKLLSRESLLEFHDQGREGLARVIKTYREIEHTFLSGCDKANMPLLFFIPSGEVWDDGYFDRLSSSHCVMPWRFVYPEGHAGAVLSGDGLTTSTDADGVELFVWDCNNESNVKRSVLFTEVDGNIRFQFGERNDDGSFNTQFSSDDGVTLGMMRHGAYMGSDHDLPFDGPFGLAGFIVDFLLSPADILVTDVNGLRTGRIGSSVLAEIPGSHPFYLAKGAYLLPAGDAYRREITGTGSGTYSYNTMMPDGTALVIENVATAMGQTDVVEVNADATQIRITPGVEKQFNITLSKRVGTQARAFAISGVGGNAAAAIDITVAPDLSMVRLGNKGSARTVEVKGFSIDRATNAPVNRVQPGVALPVDHDLVIAVADWNNLDMAADAISFE